MQVGDLVMMNRVDSVNLPTGIIVSKEVEYFKGSAVWCEILWDCGNVLGCWNDEIRMTS